MSKTIYQHLNDMPEILVTKYKRFSRRTNQYKSMIKNRNAVSHLLSQLHKSGDADKFDYLSSLLFGVFSYDFPKLLEDIVNSKDLSSYDERQFIKI